MIVVASAMPLAAWLLSAFAFLGGGIGGGRMGLSGGGRFGFSSIETAFQFANFALEALKVLFQIGFALDGTLMLGTPKMGLLTQFDELRPAATQEYESEKKEPSELAKASP